MVVAVVVVVVVVVVVLVTENQPCWRAASAVQPTG